MAQGEGPEFKPQYHKKQKQKNPSTAKEKRKKENGCRGSCLLF
jgi:hypothetical protein